MGIREDIKDNSFRQVYLLYGEEEYMRSAAKRSLIKAMVPDQDSMNFNRYSGSGTDESAVISQAETMPFFADKRIMLLEDTGFFKNKADKMADYMKELPDYLIMVFVESEVDKRSRMYKAVTKVGHVEEFTTQKEDFLMKWVLSAMVKDGKKITRPTMQHFLEITGTDMANIHSELEKLLSYTADKDVIEIADIDEICAPQLSDQIFDMIRCVTEHQQRKALDYYYDLLALKIPPMRTLFLLTKQFNQLLQIKRLAAEGVPNKDIASKAGIPPFVVNKSLGLCRNYTHAQLRAIVEECVQTEEDVKTGHLDDKLSVEMLIVKFSGAVK